MRGFSPKLPSGNTGVQKPGDAGCVVDWCAVTFPEDLGVGRVLSLLGVAGEWDEAPAGWRNYERSMRCDHVRIGYGGQAGIHVEFSAQGCREREVVPGTDWTHLLGSWQAVGASITRIDFAFDDREGRLDLLEIERKVKDGELTTRARKARGAWSCDIGAPLEEGRTVYVGSSLSETVVRFYDKAREQQVSGPWVRCEVQLRGERADKLVERFVAQGVSAVAAALRAHLAFRVPDMTQRPSRQFVCVWWEEFLGWAEACELVIRGAVRTIAQTQEWVKKSVGCAIAAITQACGGSWEWLVEVQAYGASRMSRKWSHMVAASLGCAEEVAGVMEGAGQSPVGKWSITAVSA